MTTNQSQVVSIMGVTIRSSYSDQQIKATLSFVLKQRQRLRKTFGLDRRVEEVIDFCAPLGRGKHHAPTADAIARAIGSPRTSTMRLLSQMVTEGWLVRRREGRRVIYTVTPKAIGAVARSASILLGGFEKILRSK